ncbi:unknown [Antheraea pernyi nucleopolyhedrovirus]|uniref:Uncharacterized protein n=2 Tax=Antheraea pernyi nuclear polyhedrosis virus TaxID=161494 RepID=Q1HH91_NPVAP|nr:hypothetical protein APNV_p006 [Antheraea pernyi nucleopolyhedrovirus]AWD33671.1 hypothetical protein [Antheraea proylei nucleopolyhedrovirus]BBD50460.1 hypothetical protein [Antheraea yamamai nucleopolyhedrovirus]BBD50612.1 hypothetical protein [Samia cynthia nucleopolyhedrovirus]ABF50248.1 unknown [Antheraea pernyi nucleopolyhedrovirus]ABQ12234.1 unknown [Antheraea pernyi nucleopolyhedrovirus]
MSAVSYTISAEYATLTEITARSLAELLGWGCDVQQVRVFLPDETRVGLPSRSPESS